VPPGFGPCRQTECPDALFRDPDAERLARKMGVDIANTIERNTRPADHFAVGGPFDEIQAEGFSFGRQIWLLVQPWPFPDGPSYPRVRHPRRAAQGPTGGQTGR